MVTFLDKQNKTPFCTTYGVINIFYHALPMRSSIEYLVTKMQRIFDICMSHTKALVMLNNLNQFTSAMREIFTTNSSETVSNMWILICFTDF